MPVAMKGHRAIPNLVFPYGKRGYKSGIFHWLYISQEMVKYQFGFAWVYCQIWICKQISTASEAFNYLNLWLNALDL